MPVTIRCPNTDCAKRYQVPERGLGSRATCKKCGTTFTVEMQADDMTTDDQKTQTQEPLFLHISPARLIILSIVSMHLYEAYWIYKNWRFIKERDGLKIQPLLRGLFGWFFCHSLLRRIHEDTEARTIQVPSFSAGGLATGWVVLTVAENGQVAHDEAMAAWERGEAFDLILMGFPWPENPQRTLGRSFSQDQKPRPPDGAIAGRPGNLLQGVGLSPRRISPTGARPRHSPNR